MTDLETSGQETGRVRVVCVGETMLMLAPPPFETIEYCDQFTAYNGGAESNVAIGLARLGVPTGWIGKLPDNALGRKIVNEIRGLGVDTTRVVWSSTGRVGTFFVEWGAPPRPLRTIYDRADSAASTLDAAELDWGYIGGADWLVLTGITPALSDTCHQMTCAAARRAREQGVKVLFDINYRALLWPADQARAGWQAILPHVTLLVGTEGDLRLLDGESHSRQELLQRTLDSCPIEAVVMTLGGEGCMAYDGQAFYDAPGHAVQPVNRLGAGDAFVAGLLYGYLQDDLGMGLRYGMAMSALKLTIPQNIPLVNRKDVSALANGQDSPGLVR